MVRTLKKEKNMALTDVKEVFTALPKMFNSGAAQGLDAVFQLDVTGEGGGSWNVVIKDAACQIQEGTHEAPNVTLTMSCETWLSIVNRDLNAMQAFMGGQLKVSGDIMLAQRIPELFQF